MPPTRPPYPPELKHQIVELVRADRSPAELARGFAAILYNRMALARSS